MYNPDQIWTDLMGKKSDFWIKFEASVFHNFGKCENIITSVSHDIIR